MEVCNRCCFLHLPFPVSFVHRRGLWRRKPISRAAVYPEDGVTRQCLVVVEEEGARSPHLQRVILIAYLELVERKQEVCSQPSRAASLIVDSAIAQRRALRLRLIYGGEVCGVYDLVSSLISLTGSNVLEASVLCCATVPRVSS